MLWSLKAQRALYDFWHLQKKLNKRLARIVSTHLLIHLSAHLRHHHHSHHPSLLHSFTPGSNPTFTTNPSHLNTSSTLNSLHDDGTGLDLSCFSIYFRSFFFNLSVCPVWWTKLATARQIHNIVSYRKANVTDFSLQKSRQRFNDAGNQKIASLWDDPAVYKSNGAIWKLHFLAATNWTVLCTSLLLTSWTMSSLFSVIFTIFPHLCTAAD